MNISAYMLTDKFPSLPPSAFSFQWHFSADSNPQIKQTDKTRLSPQRETGRVGRWCDRNATLAVAKTSLLCDWSRVKEQGKDKSLHNLNREPKPFDVVGFLPLFCFSFMMT